MQSELLDRAAAVGLDELFTVRQETRYGPVVVQTCITAVNRGLSPATVQELAEVVSPAVLALVVGVLTEKQRLAPLGNRSEAVMAEQPDAYGMRTMLKVLADKAFPMQVGIT